MLVVDADVESACQVALVLRARHAVRIAVGLRDAVHEVARAVPDVIVCAFDMPPFRGDALLEMVAREHPEVRRVLFRGKHRQGPPLSGDAAHAVLTKPLSPSDLLAAVYDGDG